jgi:hypothetical protein
MKLELKNNKFSVSNLDYEMVQIILNGIEYEKNKVGEKISYVTSCLYKDYSENEKNEFMTQINYLKNHNEKLNEIVSEFSLLIEKIDL